ncbi:MAG: DUF2779 domain-containing protein [Bacteroidia bacterium]|nr:DUF2779 domain-containing protein [Bacteroidia bacterium]
MRHVLSKSTFLYGCQCPKRLYFYKFRKDLIGEISVAQQAVFDRGTSVGQLARDLFPGGVDASPSSPFLYAKSVAYTKQLIDQGQKIIYEAAFQFEGVLAAVDILVKRNGKWKAYEVKSSTSVKEINLLDAALQYHVISKSGINLADIFLIHLNNEYIREESLVLEELFFIQTVKEDVLELQDFVGEKIVELKNLISSKKEPEQNIGTHCTDPYPCDFASHCWQHIPEPSVFSISRLRSEKKFELYNAGIIHFKDLPEDFSLNAYQAMQVRNHLDKKTSIDKPALKEYLKDITYPLYFMDFETFQPAVPLYPNSRPYQQIPFQYSLHFKKNKKSVPEHHAFLASPNSDPRPHFIEDLLKKTSSPGSILTYNMSFEKSILNALARDFPQYANDIEDRIERLLDLMPPFMKGMYYSHEMNGSYSIKAVLPALVPELSYEDLEIGDGGTASHAFEQMIFDPQAEVNLIRENLLEYCKMDTLAMVRLLEVLEKV